MKDNEEEEEQFIDPSQIDIFDMMFQTPPAKTVLKEPDTEQMLPDYQHTPPTPPKPDPEEVEPTQASLFEVETKHEKEWQGMPAFGNEDATGYQQILVTFKNKADVKAFAKLLSQNITYKTKSLWYPKEEMDIVEHLRWRSDER